MIVRKWVGTVSRQDADTYAEFLGGERGIGEYRGTPGNQGAMLLRRDLGITTEFELISIWEDVEAIKGYAGADYEQPHYYAADLAVLIDPPQLVEHREVVACELPELNRRSIS